MEVTLKQCERDLIETANKNKLTDNRIDSNLKNDPIYINDNVAQFNRNVFFKTKAFVCDSSNRFVWFKDSKMCLRK